MGANIYSESEASTEHELGQISISLNQSAAASYCCHCFDRQWDSRTSVCDLCVLAIRMSCKLIRFFLTRARQKAFKTMQIRNRLAMFPRMIPLVKNHATTQISSTHSSPKKADHNIIAKVPKASANRLCQKNKFCENRILSPRIHLLQTSVFTAGGFWQLSCLKGKDESLMVSNGTNMLKLPCFPVCRKKTNKTKKVKFDSCPPVTGLT